MKNYETVSLSITNQVLRAFAHQKWLRFGLRDRLIRRFVDPDVPTNRRFECEFFGHRYPGRLDSYIDWSVYYFGAYERPILELLKSLARDRGPQAVYFDAGANVGVHTLFMSNHCAACHAFEPFPPVADVLQERLELNQISNVTLHRVGLGETDAELPFDGPANGNLGVGAFVSPLAGGSEPSPRNPLEVDGKVRQSLPIVHGDDYLAAHGIGHVDVMKIDVEGFESHVLAGLSQTLTRSRPAVVMEYTPETQDSVGDSKHLLDRLPERYQARAIVYHEPIGKIFCRRGYRLVPLDHVPDRHRVHEVLLTPEESP